MNFYDYIKLNSNILRAIFKKIGINFPAIIIIDYIFYALTYISIILWWTKLKIRYDSVNLSANSADILELFAQASSFWYFIVLSTALLIVAIILASAITRCFIWLLATNTKLEFKRIWSFIWRKIVWNTAFAALVILSFIALKTEGAIILAGILSAAMLYFSSIIHPLLAREPKFESVKKGVMLGAAKMHYIMPPYAILAVFGIVIAQLRPLSKDIYVIILFNAVILLYLALCRYYASSLIFELDKKK